MDTGNTPARSLQGTGTMSHVAVFDVETQLTADEVGGWAHIRDMRLSVGVVYTEADGLYHTFYEDQIDALIQMLQQADLVVGYNLIRFDYEVLRRYTTAPLDDLPTLDMLADLYRILGWRPSLDSIASATLGHSKSADGLQAVRWFREGKWDELTAYCKRDVEVTWQVYEFGRRNRYVQYRDRRFKMKRVPVNWTLSA